VGTRAEAGRPRSRPGLTVVLGRQGDGRYAAAAQRFLVRFILEACPSLLNLKKVVDALDVVGRVRQMPELQEGAETALEDLGRQLRDRGGGRWIYWSVLVSARGDRALGPARRRCTRDRGKSVPIRSYRPLPRH
jgi:hypothetical protein